MPGRVVPLASGEYYHLFNRGSDKRDIYIQPRDYKRFQKTFYYYQFSGPKLKFSLFTKSQLFTFKPAPERRLVEIICYCLMPNHFHFLVRQLRENGISTFMSQLSNSYTKYFNTKYNRIGPLLQGTFQAVLIENDEQLVHVSRYIHLNPVVSEIVGRQEYYPWSSYREFIDGNEFFCGPSVVLELFPSREAYKKFVEDQADYGQTLEILKRKLLDEKV